MLMMWACADAEKKPGHVGAWPGEVRLSAAGGLCQKGGSMTRKPQLNMPGKCGLF